MFFDLSLETELKNALENDSFEPYLARAEAEYAIFVTGENCDWDKETVVSYILSDDCPSQVPEKRVRESFDNGRIKEVSKIYFEALKSYRFRQRQDKKIKEERKRIMREKENLPYAHRRVIKISIVTMS